MSTRYELGPVRFTSGFAHLSDPCYIYDTKTAEKLLKDKLKTSAFATIDGVMSENSNKEIAQTAGLKVPTTNGNAFLDLNFHGQPTALVVHFDGTRAAKAKLELQGYIEANSGQVMIADLDRVITDYQELHVRSGDNDDMPFGYDLVCLNSARNNKRGSAFRNMAVVGEVPNDTGLNRFLPVYALVENGETVGITINYQG